MIKGKTQTEKVRSLVDEILFKTNGGYDIFRYYLGKVGRCMDRPWGKKETKSSWGVFYNSDRGIWIYKDMATEEFGNAIHFVEKHFSLTFGDAIDKIKWDFGLGGKIVNVTPVQITWEKPDVERDYAQINFFHKPFTKRHHDFWNAAECSEDHCRKYNCFAVKDAAINRKRIPIGKDEIVFAFYSPEEDGVKLYFPEREKGEKFRNNISYHYLWNYSNIQCCEDLVVQKSPKDMIVTTMLFPNCIATQAEAVMIFNSEVVEKINSVSKVPWIWYGSDWDGVKKCKQITDTYKWKYINTPKNLLPEINDAYGYVKKFGLNKLEEFMKSKKLCL